MAEARKTKQRNANDIARELLALTASFNPSDYDNSKISTSEEYSALNERYRSDIEKVSSKADEYVKRFMPDVRRTWFSEDSGPVHTAEELHSEAGELLSEFIKEERTGEDRTSKIASELVDTLYFLVKLTDVERLDMRSGWQDLLLAGKVGPLWNGLYDRCPAKTLSVLVHDNAELLVVERNEYKAADILLLLLKLAGRRSIDVEKAWKEKMEYNMERKRSISALRPPD